MFNPDGDWLEIADIEKFSEYLRNLVYINFSAEGDIIEGSDEDRLGAFLDGREMGDDEIQDRLLSDSEKEEMNRVLTLKECNAIITNAAKRIRHKKTKEVKYVIDTNLLHRIVDEINQRLVSNMIVGLVSRGVLESAFDEKINDFVFWKKEKDDSNGDSKT
tara:strand:+ start:83 stop:565 length:483 start_codon:yes stop_codon:yes gene_type:complete